MVQADKDFFDATGQKLLPEEVGMGGPSSKEINWEEFFRLAHEQEGQLSELMKASEGADLRTRGLEI